MLYCCPVFNAIALIVDIFGILSNALILVFLHYNNIGSRLTTFLMKNQFIFDGLASLCALVSLVWRDEDLGEVPGVAEVLCYLWTSRSLFWFVVLLSETNLMCLAIDRLRAIVLSTAYKEYERRTLTIFYISTFGYALLNSIPSIFLVEYRNGNCRHIVEHAHSDRFNHYLIFSAYHWLLFGYLLHGIAMGVCHFKVMHTIRRVLHFKNKHTVLHLTGSHNNQPSECPNAFSGISAVQQPLAEVKPKKNNFVRSVTIPAIIMWTAFLITHAYQAIFFLLYAHNVIDFVSYSVERRIATLSTIINSACNPMIMIISSPPFRRSVHANLKAWFRCGSQSVN